MIAAFIQVATDDSIILDSRQIYGICLVILVVYGLISGLATSIIARLQVYFATVNILSSIAIVIALVVTASNKGNVVPAKTAFFEFTNNISWLNSPGFTFLISTTGPLWCLTGYDSAAHISEESSNASTAAPRAIIYAVSAMGVLGWATMLAISFVTTDVTSVVNSTLPLPMAQILLDNMGKKGMLAAWFFVTLTQIVGGIPQCIDASRAVYAFSRDGALPLSRYWRRLNPKTLTPIHAVWFVVFSSAVLGLLALVNLTAVEAIFNCAALALYISYAIPILMRITYGRKTFQPGPFSLGSFSVPIGTVACCFVLVQIPVQLFPLGPVTNPLDMNYAVVVLGTILIGSLGWFFLGARRWFQGPRLTILEGSSTAMEINCDNEKIRKEMENEITWTAGQAV
ncbi:uncharacterized protein SPPG_01830 [Spizellomyces punctatus DAOM BR117]|uniref:Amino acid permease/ SLC12A domain-containing protein n=1 Tax=Spizellomyces punctatus (strain DAOM BR117) TaxID=645134 RepID=A0A0L0HNS9_SPIPD|nr:uncharacterized protein SPPG_01830 [Spizellomyces punctatus DAOM BR117]KND02747.1 hypothetical protein SPPG_01830 [Spizellomyces punctatus DAOM BR117]|eukprot:XP_016610786.1 hypothetical protein SPPG_01830 [Spizellomyces punctatus DAOM BR117]